MPRMLSAVLVLGWLAACGADGPPERPVSLSEPAPSPELRTDSYAQAGVVQVF